MKRVLSLLVFVCLFTSICTIFVSASEVPESSEESIPETTEEINNNISNNIVITGTQSPITPNNTNGFKNVLVSLIGNYDVIVSEYRYTSSQGYTNINIEQQPDYVWIISCAGFWLVIYCLFRLLGGVLCGRK